MAIGNRTIGPLTVNLKTTLPLWLEIVGVEGVGPFAVAVGTTRLVRLLFFLVPENHAIIKGNYWPKTKRHVCKQNRH